MKLLSITLALSLMAGTALAQGRGNANSNNGPEFGGNSSASASASARASSRSSAWQMQQQIQSLKAQLSAYQKNEQNVSQGNSQNYNEAKNSGYAPGIGLGGFASGPCVGVTTQGGASFGAPGGVSIGVGGGRSELDDECTKREWVRILHSIGDVEGARAVVRTSKVVQDALAPKQTSEAPAAPSLARTVAEIGLRSDYPDRNGN